MVPVNHHLSSSGALERHGALEQNLLPFRGKGKGWQWCLSKQLFPGSRMFSNLTHGQETEHG